MKQLKIDIVSDVMCPWCIIGYNNLVQALDQLKGNIEAEINWHPFELNPDMPIEGQDLHEHLMQKYGLTQAQADENRERLSTMGKRAGFEFNFDGKRIMINSFDCHRLLTWAKTLGKQTELKLALFKAHFTDLVFLNQQEALLEVVATVGLDVEKAKAILESDEYAQAVRTEEEKMHEMGISSVPTFIINNQYAISGGQPTDSFKQALQDISAKL